MWYFQTNVLWLSSKFTYLWMLLKIWMRNDATERMLLIELDSALNHLITRSNNTIIFTGCTFFGKKCLFGYPWPLQDLIRYFRTYTVCMYQLHYISTDFVEATEPIETAQGNFITRTCSNYTSTICARGIYI